ncbi:MAG: TIGR02266 family protein [Deltaproteobacteria bacterium]|nr:TIGR02266 family protein [Deltaproteobacteria bacterium]
MVDPNTRQGKRTPVTLKIKFKSETLEQFIERYAVDVSQGGIFIRTKEPLAVGTQMRFEFQLRDASPLIGGEGTVVWTRENDPSRPAIAPGMGVRFDRLAEGSQNVLERILSEKAKQAPSRPNTEPTKPPMFTDTPTRVAPLPVQEALLGGEGSRKRSESFGDQRTPLPAPVPFHSDAEDFDEQAFEEATKVRSLDDLVAENEGLGAALGSALPSRSGTPSKPPATRAEETRPEPQRAETATVVEKPTVVDRDSAPTLPSPPESRPQPRLLETTPSPRTEEPGQASPALASSSSDNGKTRLGVEPASAKAPVRAAAPVVAKDAVTKPTGMRAVARESSAKMPVAKSGSGASLIILLLLLVAAGGAAVWFFVLREKAEESVAENRPADTGSGSAGSGSSAAVIAAGSGSGTGSAEMVGSGSATGSGSAGSASAMTGSGSAVATPAAELVETVIAASADKASVEVLGTDQKGATPLKAKLEKGKAYKARVQAPGFAMLELDIKGGDPKTTAKLVAKPRMISVTSQPAGAVIFIDSTSTGKTTPSTIELTKTQAAKKSVRVGIRKTGYRSIERVVDTSKYTEDAARMIAQVEEPLTVQAPVTNNNTTNNNNNNTPVKTGSGSAVTPAGSGSAGTTTGSAATPAGSGSATTPTPTPTPGAGSGSAVKPAGTGTGSATTPPPAGTGSATPVKPPATGSGSATTPMAAPKPATGEPEPDFMKKP